MVADVERSSSEHPHKQVGVTRLALPGAVGNAAAAVGSMAAFLDPQGAKLSA